MTLDQVPLGAPCRIVGFKSLDERERERLVSLGLRPSARVTKLLLTPLRDPVECLVDSQLLALEARVLPHVRVEPAAP